MDLWYSEYHTKNVRFSIKIKQQIASCESRFQKIAIFDTFEYGRVLVLDGYLMVTEKDEFVYHEMITHIPMAVNTEIKDILVVGAGDGGTLRELVKYRSVERIDVAEIDKEVVEMCKQHLPTMSESFDDKRIDLHFEDGLKFVRNRKNEYDLIIVDSTDPFGPGEGLFTKEFYGSCFRALKSHGILTNQHENPFYKNDASAAKKTHKKIKSVFPISLVYQAHIPTYPSGHWLFGFAAKKHHPLTELNKEKWNEFNIKTKYYNTNLHIGAFALPNYVLEVLDE